jgi:hypothetical protein
MSDSPVKALLVLLALWTAAGLYGLATSASAREAADEEVAAQSALETLQLCQRLGLREAHAAERCMRMLITVVEDREKMRAPRIDSIF